MMFCTIPFFIVPSAPTTTGITSVFICQMLCISSSKFLLYHTPSEYNQSCSGKHFSQNMHSSQPRYFLHLANHTTSRYILNILVQQWHSCSLDIPHSRHFDFQVFTFRELLKFFRWHIYVWWDGDVLKVQYLVVWALTIISGLMCLRALSVLIDTSQRIVTMSFSPTPFWLEFTTGVSMS